VVAERPEKEGPPQMGGGPGGMGGMM